MNKVGSGSVKNRLAQCPYSFAPPPSTSSLRSSPHTQNTGAEGEDLNQEARLLHLADQLKHIKITVYSIEVPFDNVPSKTSDQSELV